MEGCEREAEVWCRLAQRWMGLWTPASRTHLDKIVQKLSVSTLKAFLSVCSVLLLLVLYERGCWGQDLVRMFQRHGVR